MRAEIPGGVIARRATIKSHRRDFVQNRFKFYPKKHRQKILALLEFSVIKN